MQTTCVRDVAFAVERGRGRCALLGESGWGAKGALDKNAASFAFVGNTLFCTALPSPVTRTRTRTRTTLHTRAHSLCCVYPC
jgi:hypothetical protein